MSDSIQILSSGGAKMELSLVQWVCRSSRMGPEFYPIQSAHIQTAVCRALILPTLFHVFTLFRWKHATNVSNDYGELCHRAPTPGSIMVNVFTYLLLFTNAICTSPVCQYPIYTSYTLMHLGQPWLLYSG